VPSLYITEYSGIAPQGIARGSAQASREQPIAEQKLSIGATAVLSSTFNVNTRLVRLHADSGACSVLFGGAGVVATAASQRLASGVSEFKGIPDKQVVTNLSVITNS